MRIIIINDFVIDQKISLKKIILSIKNYSIDCSLFLIFKGKKPEKVFKN